MGRRCACDQLLEAMRNDPRLRVIPPAARYMWLALADALMRLPMPGVFLLGSRVGSIGDIQMMLSMDKPDVETCLGILLETQLVTRRDDGVLVIPEVVAAPERMSVSARNGSKSLGRPRKGESKDQYKLRLMSVVPNAPVETQPIPAENNLPRGRAAAASSSPLEAKKEAKQQSTNPTDLGNHLAEIAGLDTLRGVFNFRPIDAWLAGGATPELLIATISAVSSRSSYTPPRSFGYFTAAVRDAIAAAKPVATNTAAAEYSRSVEAYAAAGFVGPAPVWNRGMAA